MLSTEVQPRSASQAGHSHRIAHKQTVRPLGPSGEPSAYDLDFWLAYVGNLLIMVAVAVLYRYADFVTVLGGSEWHLGWIVGVGMVGSFSMRLVVGVGIDRRGPRLVWLTSLVLFSATCFAHLALGQGIGPATFILRIAFTSAVAGIFGSSVTHISNTVPVRRMAEMIGMLGTAGFLGMVFGTQLGDWLLAGAVPTRGQVDSMFLWAGGLGVLSAGFIAVATRRDPVPARRRRPPVWGLLLRYQPGPVLGVSVVMGLSLSLPTVFLRTYAAQLGIAQIGPFFAVYAPTAILTRLATRQLPERMGLKPTIVLAMGLLAVSMATFLVVHSAATLIIPGIGFGVAHAMLYPATVAAGSRAFPQRHRGLGITIMLAAYDLGTLLGSPAIGVILTQSGKLGLPAYPSMFVVVGILLMITLALYAWKGPYPEAPPAPKRLR